MAVRACARSSRALLAAWTAVVVMVAVLLLAPAPSAHALDGRLEFSRDGVTWDPRLPEALFDGEVVLVPGGSVSATLHMRSTADTSGVLAAALTNVRVSDPGAAAYFNVRATSDGAAGVDGAGLERTSVVDLEEHTQVGSPFTLAPGQSAQFTLTIDLDLRPDGTGAQNSDIGMDLSISFTDAAAAGPGDEGATPPQVIPALPPDGDSSGPGSPGGPGALGAPGDRGDPAGPMRHGAVGEDVDTGTAAPGLLAVTGIARSAILTGIAVTLLGALLLAVSRRMEGRP